MSYGPGYNYSVSDYCRHGRPYLRPVWSSKHGRVVSRGPRGGDFSAEKSPPRYSTCPSLACDERRRKE